MKGRKIFFWVGLSFLILLGALYFVTIQVDGGANYLTEDRILGIIIFHNPLALFLYVLVGLSLIYLGISKKKRK